MGISFYLGIVPAVLVILLGMLILDNSPEEDRGKRFIFYLLGFDTLLLIVLLVAPIFTPEPGRNFNLLINLLVGPFVGIVSLVVLNIRFIFGMNIRQKVLLAALFALQVVILLVADSENSLLFFLPLTVPALLIGWWFRNRKLLPILMVIVFCGVIFLYPLINSIEQLPVSRNISMIGIYLLFLISGLAIVIPAMLIGKFADFIRNDKSEDTTQIRATSAEWVGYLIMSVLLIAAVGYQTYWASIWDQTSDGLGGLFFFMTSSVIAIASGMIIASKGKLSAKISGLLFAILVPVGIGVVFRAGWDVSYHEITENRAARIQNALGKYHEREGNYPSQLSQLTPRDMLVIRPPVILQGEPWCYQARGDSYRLGAIYREYFSTPFSIQEYASSGNLDGEWDCAERMAEIRDMYEAPPLQAQPENIPTPVPQPTSQVSILREPVEPLLLDASIRPGTWSPDGKTWIFSTYENTGDSPGIRVHFLNTQTGEMCASSNEFVYSEDFRNQYGWLPDGRLLFISSNSVLSILHPCTEFGESINDQYPVEFEEIVTSHRDSGYLLLKHPDLYWILDGNTLDAWPLVDVIPNQFELHWDNFAWSPDGSTLAISRQNGRNQIDGSMLYLVDPESGAVQFSTNIDATSDQHAPYVDWLTDYYLEVQSPTDLTIYDFSSSPPKIQFAFRDLFQLKVKYPDEISAHTSFGDPETDGFYLAARLNTRGDTGIYIYRSATGEISSFDSERNAVLQFSDRDWHELPLFSIDTLQRDEYDLYRIDMQSNPSNPLIVEGHRPREYPHLNLRHIPGSSQMIFSSQQGISLVSVPDGELLRFWELAGGSGIAPYVQVAPDGNSLIVVADFIGIYWIPLGTPLESGN